ncbi:hypothetical protein [Bacillus suaedaesalsae]|uniref:Stage II sporulation protein B n=1 Tax=Bacillus suaedaesalsae TaxID=2810349 RepID=A0ABS2DMM2_9BACI|nr:hypothetical protein [Bacillus suaedaesalsae]MBM6619750.1 hypothetical protein [Bacillus suaedaesalsae]
MDKPKVTIKINGKERSFFEATSETEKVEKKSVREKPIETDYEEELTIVDIDEVLAKEEIAAANQEEDEFDWVLPKQPVRDHTFNRESIVDIDDLRKKKTPTITSFTVGSSFKKKKNKEAYPLKTLLLSIVSALVVGTCFGMVVLRMFTGETIPVATNQTEQVEKATPGKGSENDGKGAGEVNKESFTAPSLDVFLVQGGAFSSETQATPIMEELKNKGFASTSMSIDGNHFLFIGIGFTKEIGTAISKPYNEQGQDTYVKSISTPEKNVTADPEVLKARQLFDQLLSYTTNKYSSTTQAIEWAEITKAAETLKKSDEQSSSASYISAVKDAYEKAASYESSGDTKDFWSTQQTLLTCYQIYQKWILEQK